MGGKNVKKSKSNKAGSRENLISFMDARGLKPHPWATKAGIRSSTLYNFLAGKSASLSSDTLQKLAKVAGCTVDELLEGKSPAKVNLPALVQVTALVGVYGRLFEVDEVKSIERPAGVPDGVEVLAARVDGDGLHPIPAGWHVFYEAKPRPPVELIGKLAVVAVEGRAERMVRQLQKGSVAGLYTLIAWGSGPMTDIEVKAAHAVLSIAQVI